MPYRAPVADFQFVLDHVVGFAEVAATERFADAVPETVQAVLAEAGRWLGRASERPDRRSLST